MEIIQHLIAGGTGAAIGIAIMWERLRTLKADIHTMRIRVDDMRDRMARMETSLEHIIKRLDK